MVRWNTRTNRGTTGRRVGRRHIRICAVIDVEQRRLGTFEQDLLMSFACLGKKMRSLTNKWPQTLNQRRNFFENLVGTKRLLAEKYNDAICFFEIAFDSKFE